MRHTVPFARTDWEAMTVEKMVKWLKSDELIAGLSKLEAKDELPILLDFLVEYAGGLELARLDMIETLTTQAAIKYKAYATSVMKIKSRILDIAQYFE